MDKKTRPNNVTPVKCNNVIYIHFSETNPSNIIGHAKQLREEKCSFIAIGKVKHLWITAGQYDQNKDSVEFA